MQHYQGQNYKVNRKIKEEVDKNQVNYRESSNDPISVIKRVYIYITDKKGKILRNVNITIDGKTYVTSNNGLLISNFPNEEKTIIAEKEGYKSATATIILNAETQTHEFFLALETDDDESEVISTDNTQPKEEFKKCGTLFELSDNNTLVVWAPSKFTNEIVDGVYTGKGSYIEQGWSNKGLWQLDYDIKYNNNSSSYNGYYVGVMPFCSAEINPFTDAKRNNYCMESWEKSAALNGMGAACLEGPKDYKYNNQDEYHHATVKKVAKNKIEYYFDNNKWIYLVPNLPNLETLHFGYRDNPANRSGGSTTISSKNIEVIGLCPESELLTLNDTVNLGDYYQFISYNDAEGNEEWGPGIVQIESIPEDDELYIGVKVIENEANDSFIGQTFYVKKDSQVGNNIYPLYSDELGTETGIYVAIVEKIESETPEETYDITISADRNSLHSVGSNTSTQIYAEVNQELLEQELIYVYDSTRITVENNYIYFPIECSDTQWNINIETIAPDIVNENKEVVVSKDSLLGTGIIWSASDNTLYTQTPTNPPEEVSEISENFVGFLRYDITSTLPSSSDIHATNPPYFGFFDVINEPKTISSNLIQNTAELKVFVTEAAKEYTSNTCVININDDDNTIMMFSMEGVIAGPSDKIYTINCLINDNFESLTITELSPEPTSSDEQHILLNETISLREPESWEIRDYINGRFNGAFNLPNHTIYAGTNTLDDSITYFFGIPNNTEEDDSTDYDIIISTDKETLSGDESAEISVTINNNEILENSSNVICLYNLKTNIEFDSEYVYVPFECGDETWLLNHTRTGDLPAILNEQKEVIVESTHVNPPASIQWSADTKKLTMAAFPAETQTTFTNEVTEGFKGFFKYHISNEALFENYFVISISGPDYSSYNYTNRQYNFIDAGQEIKLKGIVVNTDNINHSYEILSSYTSNTCTITKTE